MTDRLMVVLLLMGCCALEVLAAAGVVSLPTGLAGRIPEMADLVLIRVTAACIGARGRGPGVLTSWLIGSSRKLVAVAPWCFMVEL